MKKLEIKNSMKIHPLPLLPVGFEPDFLGGFARMIRGGRKAHQRSTSLFTFLRVGTGFAKLLLALAMLELVVPAAFAGAKQKDRTLTFTVKNEAGAAGKGFYIAVPGIGKDQVDIAKSGGKTLTNVRVNPPPVGGKGVTVFFENKDNGIADGATETITLRLTGLPANSDSKFGTSGFRNKGDQTGTPIGDATFNPGFKVVGDPVYSLLNNDEVPQDFEIHDLQFLVNTSELADPSIALDFSNSYGFGTSQPTFFLQSSDVESMPFNLPSVDDGNWLYVRGRLFQGGVEVSDFVQGADYVLAEPVPEPATWAMLALGLPALLASRHRKGA